MKNKTKKLIIGGSILVVTIAIILAVVLLQKPSGKNQLTPPHADNSYALTAFPNAPKPSTPLNVVIYEDYQCPTCYRLETGYGDMFYSLAAKGKINLQYHTLTFLDEVNKTQNKKSSTRAAELAACADQYGFYESIHKDIFAIQPQKEGQGYSDDQLLDLVKKLDTDDATKAKISQCYNDHQMSTFVTNSEDSGMKSGVTSTPTIHVNGKTMQLNVLGTIKTEDDLLSALQKIGS